jgi:cysteinyl-tRNA synthetase
MGGIEDPKDVAQALGRAALQVLDLGLRFEDRFYEAMDDDFNTAKALGYAFELARAINRLSNHKQARRRAGPVVAPALKAFSLMGTAMGIMSMDSGSFEAEVRAKRLPSMGLTEAQVTELLANRLAARAERDWARADSIRDELEAKGIVVMDTPQGTDWRVRL